MAEPALRTAQDTTETRRPRPVAANSGGHLREALDDFLELKEMAAAQEAERALHDQPQMVSRFYDVVTKFYEYGWGQSFHFYPRRSGEGLQAALHRHETDVGELLALGPGMKVADIGCGVGGPLVTIAKATGASITGINFNAYQIARGERSVRRAGLQETCDFLLASFMDVPLEDGHFDAVYSFEATCHAPDRGLCFKELHRLLRPGGELALIDWCLTDNFDEEEPVHRDIRDRIEFGNATPNLPTTSRQLDLVRSAGFEVLSSRDQALEGDPGTPWYRSLQGRDLSLASLGRIPVGRWFTARATGLLELLRIAPAGTSEAARILNVAGDELPYPVPRLPEVDDGSFVFRGHYDAGRVQMHIIEFVENAADFAHFTYIHEQMNVPWTGIPVPGIKIEHTPGVEFPEDRPWTMDFLDDAVLKFRGRPLERTRTRARATFTGPASIVNFRFFIPDAGEIDLCQTHLPVGPLEQQVDFHWFADRKLPRLLVWYVVGSWISQWRHDIEIWENKTYLDHPTLCRDDGPIVRMRRWYRQFLPDARPAAGSPREAPGERAERRLVGVASN